MLPSSFSRCLNNSILFTIKHCSGQVRVLHSNRIKFKTIEDDKTVPTHVSLEKITNALAVINAAKLQIIEALASIDNETKLIENRVQILTTREEYGPAVTECDYSDKRDNIIAAGVVAAELVETVLSEPAKIEEIMNIGIIDVAAESEKVGATKKVITEDVILETIAAKEVIAEESIEQATADHVILEAASAEEVVTEAAIAKAVNVDPDTTKEILTTEVIAEAATVDESMSTGSVSDHIVAESSSPIFDNIMVPTAEKITVHLAKDAILSTAKSIIEATRDVSVEGKVIETVEEVYPEIARGLPETTEGMPEAPETVVTGISPLTPVQLKAVQESCRLYAPLGSILTLPFTDYCMIKKRLRYKSIASLSVFGVSGFASSVYYSYTFFPTYFGPEPALIMGLDSVLFMGGASVLVGVGISYLGSALVRQLSMGWFTGMYRKLYKERESDFVRRAAHHRCSSSSSYSDDYYGDKIADVSDYRFWIRQQQLKKVSMKKKTL